MMSEIMDVPFLNITIINTLGSKRKQCKMVPLPSGEFQTFDEPLNPPHFHIPVDGITVHFSHNPDLDRINDVYSSPGHNESTDATAQTTTGQRINWGWVGT
jgi:hypothetical protein